MPGVLYRKRSGEIEVWTTEDVSGKADPTSTNAWLNMTQQEFDAARTLAASNPVKVSGGAVVVATQQDIDGYGQTRQEDALTEEKVEVKTLLDKTLYAGLVRAIAQASNGVRMSEAQVVTEIEAGIDAATKGMSTGESV